MRACLRALLRNLMATRKSWEKKMYKKTTKLLAALGLVGGMLAGTGAALASGDDAPELKHEHWSFDGYTGMYDKAALKRGLQVYRDVCSGCHSLELVAFRNLSDKGGLEMPVKDMKALAAEYEFAGIDDEGEEITRPGGAPDYFPGPYANSNMASGRTSPWKKPMGSWSFNCLWEFINKPNNFVS